MAARVNRKSPHAKAYGRSMLIFGCQTFPSYVPWPVKREAMKAGCWWRKSEARHSPTLAAKIASGRHCSFLHETCKVHRTPTDD